MTYEEEYIERLDRDEDSERKRRIIKVRFIQDKLLKEIYLDEQSRGYCPRCHCLLPLNGKCDNCN